MTEGTSFASLGPVLAFHIAADVDTAPMSGATAATTIAAIWCASLERCLECHTMRGVAAELATRQCQPRYSGDLAPFVEAVKARRSDWQITVSHCDRAAPTIRPRHGVHVHETVAHAGLLCSSKWG